MRKAAGFLAFACAFALCFALAGCGSSGASSAASSDSASAGASSADSATASESASAEAESPAAAAAGEAVVTADDLASVDVTIEYGDFDSMDALANAIQNGESDGQVVQVDGLVNNFARGMSYSIMEPSADGSQKTGTTFIIDGVEDQPEEDVYPADGTHVKLVGKVGLDPSGVYYLIYTLPDFIEVVE